MSRFHREFTWKMMKKGFEQFQQVRYINNVLANLSLISLRRVYIVIFGE